MDYEVTKSDETMFLFMSNPSVEINDCWATSVIFRFINLFNLGPGSTISQEIVLQSGENQLLIYQPLEKGNHSCKEGVRSVGEYQRQ